VKKKTFYAVNILRQLTVCSHHKGLYIHYINSFFFYCILHIYLLIKYVVHIEYVVYPYAVYPYAVYPYVVYPYAVNTEYVVLIKYPYVANIRCVVSKYPVCSKNKDFYVVNIKYVVSKYKVCSKKKKGFYVVNIKSFIE
jgi:hypothetical protein